MSFLFPEEDDLIPRQQTRRFYDREPEEASSSPALLEPKEKPTPVRALSPEYTAAMNKVRQVLAERPERKPTSKWGAIGAMAVGAGAGLVNASGRTRIDPNTTQGAIDNLTGETGFRRRDEDWRRRLEAVGQEAQMEGSKLKAQQDQEEFGLNTRFKQSQIDENEATAEQRRALANKPTTPPSVAPGHGVWNSATNKYEVPIPSPEPVEKTFDAQALEIIRNPKLGPEEKKAQLAELSDARNQIHPVKETQERENPNQWVADSLDPDPKISGPAIQKLATWEKTQKDQRPPISIHTGNLSNEQYKRTQDLQNEARLDPETKIYHAVRDAYAGMSSAAKQRNGIGDLTIMRLFAKLTDPITGVREEEYRTMQGALGALNRLGVIVSGKWLKGEQLTDDGRKAFMEMATPLLQQREQTYTRTLDRIKKKATDYGVNPDLVLDGLYPQQNGQGASIRYTANGRTYNIPVAEEAAFLKDHPTAKKASN